MHRLDRLFAIATRLQGSSTVRAEDLARRFEVSTRTIYRDVAALADAGVPVVSLPGQGYRLAEGYFLPPLVFSGGEATALLLGARLLSSQAVGPLAEAADHAIAKVAAVLDATARRRLDELDATVSFRPPDRLPPALDLADPTVGALRAAIADRRVVEIRYRGRNRGDETTRLVEPGLLSFADGAWYLAGYCRLRGAGRAFRLDRIQSFAALEETFLPRSEPRPPAPAVIEVRVRFSAQAARIAAERQHWSFVRMEVGDGDRVAVYAPERLDEIASWILGWGCEAEALAPAELRTRLRDEALRLAEMLT